jgi:conjugative relaxase-like TrwC/TraI family protein
LVATFAVVHRASYYTSRPSTYYQADAEEGGVWLRGNQRLGIVQGSPVDPLTFDRLCEGCDANGKKLVKTPIFKRRMLGVDITLSSPKAVSVLYAAGNTELQNSIADAERAAVEATLRLIEKEIPLARRGHDGFRREHAKFVAAVFTHSEARPEKHADGSVLASVQRHHHLCFPSICVVEEYGSDGATHEKFLGINSVALRKWKKALGACYRLQLATELEQRGFAIDRADDDWRWSVKGVPEAVAKFFSARRSAIEAELAKSGLTSGSAPAVAAAIARNDRLAKEAVNSDDRLVRWQQAIRNLGFDPDAIVASAREAGREAATAREPAKVERHIRSQLSGVPAALVRHEATFERQHLIEATCNALVATGTSADLAIRNAQALLDDRAIVGLGTTRDGPVLSTPAMVAIERRLIETAVDLAQTTISAPAPETVRGFCRQSGLSQEQIDAALAASSGRRVVSVLAPAGSGKSTLLSAIARSFESSGYSVAGASVAWRAAIDLGQSVDIPSVAVDAMLFRMDANVAAGKPAFAPKTVFVIDESSLQSSPQLGRILDHIKAGSTSSALIMVGDERQLRPIGPGHAIRLVREAIGAITLSQIHRQREAWAREAPQAFARGEAKEALAAFDDRGLVKLHDGLKATVEALADDWQRARASSPKNSIAVVTKTNAECRAVASVLRERLKLAGAIGSREIILPAVDASGNSHMLPVAVGDSLVSLCRIDGLGVVNGTPLRIERISVARATNAITITAQRGSDLINFAPEEFANGKGRVRLANGLVSTIFRSQGVTVDQAFVLLNDRFDRHDALVSSSRSRGDTHLYVARTGALDSAIRAEGEGNVDDKRRIDYLARRLSRERVKTTTLDLVDAGLYAKRHAARGRGRSKELSHEL